MLNEFTAGGHYGIELSSMNNYKIIKETIKRLKKKGIQADRFDECRGLMRLTDREIKDILSITRDHNIGMIFSIGPRAIYSLSAFVKSENGKRMGYRLHGSEQVKHALDEIKRGVELGVKGFLMYDEGLLSKADSLRKTGTIPKETIFKLSVHCGCANYLSAQIYEKLGADTINVVPDLSITDLKDIRKKVKVPLDLFTDTAKAAGAFLRTYDVPQFISVAAPVYLKCGPISQAQQNHLPTSEELEERVKQTLIVKETIQRYLPKAKQVSFKEKTRIIYSK